MADSRSVIKDQTYYPGKYQTLYEMGHAYTYSDYRVYGADEVADYVFDSTGVPATAKLEAFVPTLTAEAGPVTLETYVVITAADDGTLLTPFNRLGSSENTTTVVIRLNPTISDTGTRISGRMVPATAGVIVNVGSTGGGELPFGSVPGIKTLLRVTNTNGADTMIEFRITFFEY